MTDEIWSRRDDENAEQWAAFQYYLTMSPRNASDCAKMIQKSETTVRRWAARHDWRRRATAFDESALEQARQNIRQQLSIALMNRWQQSEQIANHAASVLERKLDSASPRTASEVYYSATDLQLKLIERLKMLEDTGGDRELRIEIVAATDEDRPKS